MKTKDVGMLFRTCPRLCHYISLGKRGVEGRYLHKAVGLKDGRTLLYLNRQREL